MRKFIYNNNPQNNSLENKIKEYVNDYGNNFDTCQKQSLSIDEVASKSGPNCLTKHLNRDQR